MNQSDDVLAFVCCGAVFLAWLYWLWCVERFGD